MNNLKKHLKLAINKLVERLLILISLLTLANLIFSPVPALADTENSTINSGVINVNYQLVAGNAGQSLIQILNPEVMFNGSAKLENGHLPQNNGLLTKYTVNTVLTAYNSDIGQTDDSPCITASGFDVCKHGAEDTVAINGYRMGTRVRFPELFGDRVFVVRDRMNARYNSTHVDVWMLSKADAKSFGIKSAKMEVLD
jgi:3D (Asp-Asp-Asp) domain-containing protein